MSNGNDAYRPQEGDLVFITYLKDRREHDARALFYQGKRYLTIATDFTFPNDPTVEICTVLPDTVIHVEPLCNHPQPATDLERAVALAINHNETKATVEIPIIPL